MDSKWLELKKKVKDNKIKLLDRSLGWETMHIVVRLYNDIQEI